MKNVHVMAKELVAKEMNLMDSYIKTINVTDLFEEDSGKLEVLAKTMSVVNAANEIMVEQARLLVEMNEKLDKLMKTNEK